MARRKLKVGMSLWHVYADPEDTVSMMEYVIRSIKRPAIKRYTQNRNEPNTIGKRVYLIHKDSHTWGKRSSKNGDYGWLSGISECSRDDFTIDEYEKSGLPNRLSFTKAGAYKIAISKAQKKLKEIKTAPYWRLDDGGLDLDYIKLYEKMISKLKGLYTKSKKK